MVNTAIDLSMPISITQIVETKRHQTACDSDIGQHLLNNDQCALNYDNKRFSILAAACSSFHLNRLETAYIKTSARCYADRKSLFTLSNSFDDRCVLIWPLAALSLTFRYCKIILGLLYITSAVIGLS